MRRKFARLVLLAVLAAFLAPLSAPAFAKPPSSDPLLRALLARLAADPTTPNTYSSSVKLHVKMRMFPWISVTLSGNEAYKRPGLYHFVFRDLPQAAEHFHDLNYDLGNPTSWPKTYEIALLTPAAPGVDPVIRLTPKKHGMVKTLDVTVDAVKGHIQRAVWSRFDGGVITLINHYNTVGANEIVGQQTASIDIPHMSADLEADYSEFELGTSLTSKAP